MSKSPSPLLGFNNNVRHKGRIFHIQTEDSGVKHPHVITHLFMDGGRILKTQKTSYADSVGVTGMADTVRALMKQQHKAMFIALRDGDYDALIAKKSSGEAPPPVQVRATTPPPPPPPMEPEPQAMEPLPPIELPAEAAAGVFDHEPQTLRDAPIELDVEAIERAAVAASREGARPSMMPGLAGAGLPPPPPEVLQTSRAGGGYREVATPETRRPTQRPPSVRPPSVAPREAAPRASHPPSTGKYAVSRPASIFSSNRPPEGRSIFGEDLISEKSLDEVILSYLAEDLEGPPPKK